MESPKRRVCFLSMDSLADSPLHLYLQDDEFAVKELKTRGYEFETVSWRSKGVNWAKYDLVVIRSTWDYQYHIEEFSEILNHISLLAPLENFSELVKLNQSKAYLKEFQSKGVKIVPTQWFDLPPIFEEVTAVFVKLGVTKMVVKPQIGAGSECTYVLDQSTLSAIGWRDIVKEYMARPPHCRGLMIQPFRAHIQLEGEYSLTHEPLVLSEPGYGSSVYFGESFSHMVLKTPKKGDFRVQQAYGSNIGPVTDSRKIAEIRAYADNVHALIPRNPRTGRLPLYSRVDLVRNADDEFELMELECIEPVLYFLHDPVEAPKRFADALETYLRKEKH